MIPIRDADELLELAADQAAYIKPGCYCSPTEVDYALLSGRGYRTQSGDVFVLSARRQVAQERPELLDNPPTQFEFASVCFVGHRSCVHG